MQQEHITHSYRDLIVWQRSIDLVAAIYELTKLFPREEVYGLVSQMRRCAVSIASNIAEGRGRGTRKDYVQFLRIAFGSGAELETQLIVCKRVLQLTSVDYQQAETLLEEVMKMLNVMIRNMNKANQAK